jgi:hypothetical protein
MRIFILVGMDVVGEGRADPSQSGRPAQNASSITHWRKFSWVTGAASSMPKARASAISAGPVAGTMQSTMELGKVQCPVDPSGQRRIGEPGQPCHRIARDRRRCRAGCRSFVR